MTESELASILNLHKAWIIGEDYGKRADLSRANLGWAAGDVSRRVATSRCR